MRCYSCNKILTTKEACSKWRVSGNFTEMCFGCFLTIADDNDLKDNDNEDTNELNDGSWEQYELEYLENEED